MALRIVENAGRTDVGRQRSANEDDFVLAPPFFAVADGMGGAKAGEVASAMATEVFEGESDSSEPAEAQLARMLREANKRIHDLAVADESHRGMGTTLTAAKVTGDEISLAHVGDSRAYRMRDGELEQLTKDHSLVAELERSGQITAEAAEHHPQRSIITRALGPEPEVEVDTMTYPARPGDVFLLCSDGLTTMVPEARIARILGRSRDLDSALSRLIREANEGGGRDNITAIAFRLDEEAVAAEEQPTMIGPAPADAEPAPEPVGVPAERPAAPPRAPVRRWPRRLAGAAVVLLIVAGLGVAAVFGARQVYFLGVDEGGRMALYRGLPYELPFGIDLYDERYSSPVQVASVPADVRGNVTDHELRSHDDAVSLIEEYEQRAAAAEAEAERPAGGGGGQGERGGGGQGGGGSQGDRAAKKRSR